MQENKKIQGKDNKHRQHVKSSQPLEPLQDKMLLGGYTHYHYLVAVSLASVLGLTVEDKNIVNVKGFN
jgi:hypothetical protein